MGIHNVFMPPHRRELIEGEIEMHLRRVTLLLARLDRADGDYDFEDDDPAGDGDCDLEDDDPAGDGLDERGECLTDDGSEMLSTLPLYGLDQSAGPVNEREAGFVRRREMMGWAPSRTGSGKIGRIFQY